MKEKELLKNFREIRKGLENLNKMTLLIAKVFYDFSGEESSGILEKDISEVQPIEKGGKSYLG